MLRCLEDKDAERMLEWMHESDVTKYLAQNFAEKTIEDCRKFILSSQENEEENIHRAICDDEGIYLGTVSLKHINKKDKNAEFAISMHADAIGTGASRFGTDGIICFAFETLGLEKVYLNVVSDNIRAKKFYHKVGFVLEGVAKRHIMIGSRLCDLEWYAVYKEKK